MTALGKAGLIWLSASDILKNIAEWIITTVTRNGIAHASFRQVKDNNLAFLTKLVLSSHDHFAD